MDAQVLIIGAGVSGLMAANVLKAAGVEVLVVDKGRSVGGRMATRRIQQGAADHGAQFFTVRTAQFQSYVDQWLAEGLVRVWGYGWSDGSLKRTAGDGHPRYVVNGGMNALTVHLAKGIQTRVNVEVSRVEWTGTHWLASYGDTQAVTARHLLLTPPVPQSLNLLRKGAVPLAESDVAALEKIEYGPCLCGMFVVEGTVDLPEPGAVQDLSRPIYWIADNQRKGISAQRVLTVHAEARYSRDHYNDADDAVLDYMMEALRPYFEGEVTVIEAQLKRWRYSVPIITHPYDYLAAQGLPLVFAGDAFGGRGRVEGAFISGLMAGDHLIQANLAAP
jgi:predicted NAD/FAD-dependent oxidoreductase